MHHRRPPGVKVVCGVCFVVSSALLHICCFFKRHRPPPPLCFVFFPAEPDTFHSLGWDRQLRVVRDLTRSLLMNDIENPTLRIHRGPYTGRQLIPWRRLIEAEGGAGGLWAVEHLSPSMSDAETRSHAVDARCPLRNAMLHRVPAPEINRNHRESV